MFVSDEKDRRRPMRRGDRLEWLKDIKDENQSCEESRVKICITFTIDKHTYVNKQF